jgi:hypothetical protein
MAEAAPLSSLVLVVAAPSPGLAPAPPSASSTALLDYLAILTDLRSGPLFEESGPVAFTVERCLYVPETGFDEFADAAGLSPEDRTPVRPRVGWCLIVMEVAVRNLRLEPLAVRDALDLRLEDGGQNLPGWDVFEPAHGALSDRLPAVMDMRMQPKQEVRGYTIFTLPEGTKNLWYAGYSKIGATQEKRYTGASRRQIGDMLGDEPVQPHRSGYKVVIGSFRVKANALAWARRARAEGLCAWVQEAYEPEGMFIVLTKLTSEFSEAAGHLYLARERGYSDAYVIGRAVQ